MTWPHINHLSKGIITKGSILPSVAFVWFNEQEFSRGIHGSDIDGKEKGKDEENHVLDEGHLVVNF